MVFEVIPTANEATACVDVRDMVATTSHPCCDALKRHANVIKPEIDDFNGVASCLQPAQAGQVGKAAQGAFESEVVTCSGDSIQLGQKDSAGGDLRRRWIEGGDAGRNEVCIDEAFQFRARQEVAGEGRFACPVGAGDNQAPGHGRKSETVAKSTHRAPRFEPMTSTSRT